MREEQRRAQEALEERMRKREAQEDEEVKAQDEGERQRLWKSRKGKR